MNEFLRQGDVGIQRVTKKPSGLKPIPTDRGRVILAYGEQTGHAHQVVAMMHHAEPPCALMEDPETGKRYLFVDRPCSLVHEEHGPIALAPGCYEVIRQREYVAADLARNVAD